MTRKELLDALKVIKDHCKETSLECCTKDRCTIAHTCGLYLVNGRTTPEDWEVEQ